MPRLRMLPLIGSQARAVPYPTERRRKTHDGSFLRSRKHTEKEQQ